MPEMPSGNYIVSSFKRSYYSISAFTGFEIVWMPNRPSVDLQFSGNVIEGAEDGAAGTNGWDGVGIEPVLTLLVVAISVDDAGGLS